MKVILSFLWIFCVSTSWQILHAQQVESENGSRFEEPVSSTFQLVLFPRITFSLGFDGTVACSVQHLHLRQEHEPMVLVLTNENLIDSLELVDSQIKQLDVFMKDFLESPENRKNIQETIEEILLPHQEQVVRTVMNRYRAAGQGIMHLIQQETFFESRPLNDLQVRKIESRLDDIRGSYERTVNEQHEYLRYSLESILDSKQMTGLKYELGDEYQLGSDVLELLCFQCAEQESRDFYSDVGDEFVMLAEARTYVLEFDGEITAERTSMPYHMIQKIVGLCNRLGAQGITTEDLDGFVEKINTDLSDYSMKIRQDLLDGIIERDGAKEMIRQFANESVSEIVDFFVSRLNSNEFLQLEKALVLATVNTEGLLFALIHGGLGRKVELSSTQKKKLVSTGKKCEEAIREELRKIELEVFKAIERELNPEQKREFKKKFDNVVPAVLPNIPFLLLDGGDE